MFIPNKLAKMFGKPRSLLPKPPELDPAGRPIFKAGLPTGYSIRARGYELRGDVRGGLAATVPFILPWSLAFSFCNELIPAPRATTPGSIVWTPPYQLPISLTGLSTPPLYCQSYSCVPCGYDGTPATDGGLPAGDYYSTALVTAEFYTPSFIQQMGDDPSNLNQLDPSNPITACEQSIQVTAKVVTKQGRSYVYLSGSSAGQPVPGTIGLLQPEAKLVLKFPRIPVLPWQLFQPYIGKINKVAILNCVKGSLLLEGAHTVVTPGVDGSIQQNLGLMFAFNPDPTGGSVTGMDWNMFPSPSGAYVMIGASGGTNPTPYTYADFTQIFNTILF